jgi:hypothetical protein
VVNHEDFGYEVIKKGREALGCRLMRGTVGDAQSGDKLGSGDSVGSKEEDGPRVAVPGPRGLGPKADWANLMRGENMEKLEWTGWAETSRWAIIED